MGPVVLAQMLATLSLLITVAMPQDAYPNYELSAASQNWTIHYAGKKSSDPQPLVVALHGGGGSGLQYLTSNGWGALAAAKNFVVIAPTGQTAIANRPASFRANPNVWNTGQLRAGSPRTRINDIEFLDSAITDAIKRFNIDPNRVYMTGHSNGAGMTWRYVTKGKHRLAAIGPVMGIPWTPPTSQTQKVPILTIFGLEDKLIPWEGGERSTPWSTRPEKIPPILGEMKSTSRTLGGKSEPMQTKMAGPVQRMEFGPLPGGAPFTVITIEGQGHQYPGGETVPGAVSMMGPYTNHLNATEKLWEFFSQFPAKR